MAELIEDITISNITMRGVVHSPLFMRLGARMRGPDGIKPGVLKRVILSNIVSSNAVAEYPSIISGIPGSRIEDVRVSDMYLHSWAAARRSGRRSSRPKRKTPIPKRRCSERLPARGFFVRHARNLEFSNIEIATAKPDERPAFWMHDVEGIDLFRVKAGKNMAAFSLRDVNGLQKFRQPRLSG